MSGILLEGTLANKVLLGNPGPYHKITGFVQNVTGKRRVYLFDKRSMKMLDAMWSDNTTGAYAFYYLEGDPRKYMVVSVDYVGDWNAEAVDKTLTWTLQ